MIQSSFPFYASLDEVDCGPSCLRMISKHYGRTYSLEFVRNLSFLCRDGVNILNLSEAAQKIGFETLLLKMSFDGLLNKAIVPCILHWNQNHFVVLYRIKNTSRGPLFYIADPAVGKLKIDQETLIKSWCGNEEKGVIMILEPDEEYAEEKIPVENGRMSNIAFLVSYLRNFYTPLSLLFGGMFLTTIISLIFPFFTQYIVDIGVAYKMKDIILLILLAQVALFIGDISVSIIRNWVLLHMSTRMSIAIVSDFLTKLINLPMRFFDTKSTGDINQRIADHNRIETFLTGHIVTVVFSIINVIVYLIILLYYDLNIFLVFALLSAISVLWVIVFMKRRKNLDYKKFHYLKENQEILYELINGMQEIKLNNAEGSKKSRWYDIRANLFKVNIKSLGVEQLQRVGFSFFSNLKNMVLSFMAANETINGHMTLGMLLSISYIIGQTNGPLEQLISFFSAAQDANISIERLQEIHGKPNEELEEKDDLNQKLIWGSSSFAESILESDIILEDVLFQYEGPHSTKVIDSLSLRIPSGKVTAIVGVSGSGKTTLMKLLLRYYEPIHGKIKIGNNPIDKIPFKLWRSCCGSVMQDGFIFSESILANITLVDSTLIDEERLQNAIYISNVEAFINELPGGLLTKIGPNGMGLSAGQKQRILIARAVYKNPSFLIFDEATSALDAQNERIIVERLNDFFKNRTVVVIAHRLSTVSDADQIVVLDRGKIMEIGTHVELAMKKGYYYNLVKNQLELGAA